MTDFLVYDVFTETAFGGNQLAVIPDATGLADDQLQRIAREFNFSETTFVCPPSDPDHTAKVRIFTPTFEMQFAGHPTVGTAVALAEKGLGETEMILELGVGPIPVRVNGSHARFETRVPLSVHDGPSPEAIGTCIGQTGAAIRTDRHPPVLAGVGANFILAELTGEAALATARPVSDAFLKLPEAGVGIFVYIRDGERIRARMFAPESGIPEDPATGSAAAALAAYLGKLDKRSQSLRIRQGVEMGRPSLIEADVTVEEGTPLAVTIGGHAVRVMEGCLAL